MTLFIYLWQNFMISVRKCFIKKVVSVYTFEHSLCVCEIMHLAFTLLLYWPWFLLFFTLLLLPALVFIVFWFWFCSGKSSHSSPGCSELTLLPQPLGAGTMRCAPSPLLLLSYFSFSNIVLHLVCETPPTEKAWVSQFYESLNTSPNWPESAELNVLALEMCPSCGRGWACVAQL